MIEQDQPHGARARLSGETFRDHPGQIEPRHDVGDDDHRVAVDFLDPLCAVGRVGDSQERVSVGVVDEGVRQHRVKDRFDRRRRGRRVSHRCTKLLHHLRIRELLERRQADDAFESDGGESGRFDSLEVPAAAFDIEDVLELAKEIALADLDRRVATAVQHQ